MAKKPPPKPKPKKPEKKCPMCGAAFREHTVNQLAECNASQN